MINSGAALYIGGAAATVKEGVLLAEKLIDSGKAADVLENFIKYSTITEDSKEGRSK